MKKIISAIIAATFFISFTTQAQEISIVNVPVTEFNLTPEALLSATIMNVGEPTAVELTSILYSSDNQQLLSVKSSSFIVKNGMNTSIDAPRRAVVVQYGSSGQASYLKTTHNLPSGNFKIVVELKTTQTSETEDKFEDVIESDLNQYLYLVSPADKDSMEITNPMLIWAHSEPFSVLAKNESFRMIVTEMKKGQTPEEAMAMNVPLMTKNNLLTHNLQYPFEARGLEEGKHYAWQVQKVANGVVVAQTDVWEFSIIKKRPLVYNKYAVLKKKLDASYYVAENNKVFFKMDEEYLDGKFNCKIYNEKREIIKPNVKNEKNETRTSGEYNVKNKGFNQFEIDLEKLNVEKGFYTLEVNGAKGDLYLLKFYVEE